MADLNNELDLNTPAAPTLTFETEAPTLTLDPAADEKVVEEAKKAAPIKVEDTPLSPEEQQMVNDFAEKIDITNSDGAAIRCSQPEKAQQLFGNRAVPRKNQGHGRDRPADHRPDRRIAGL